MTTAEMTAPGRTPEQRMEALKAANAVRTYRSRVKRDLKARRRNIVDLLLSPPAELETMKVADLMMAVPKMGRAKVDQALRFGHISHSKTVGGLSDRQRNELVARLS